MLDIHGIEKTDPKTRHVCQKLCMHGPGQFTFFGPVDNNNNKNKSVVTSYIVKYMEVNIFSTISVDVENHNKHVKSTAQRNRRIGRVGDKMPGTKNPMTCNWEADSYCCLVLNLENGTHHFGDPERTATFRAGPTWRSIFCTKLTVGFASAARNYS